MRIEKLDTSNAGDWLDFFDNRAFFDHKEWGTCYCTFFYQPKFENYQKLSSSKRDYAIWLIENRIMQGYLAYDDDNAIAWCNANSKNSYPRLKISNPNEDEYVKSIVCFIVEKNYRGKGIASALLRQALDDAKEEKFKIVEAYPNKRAEDEYSNYHGVYAMYRKNGFIDEKVGNRIVARKYL